MIQITDIHKSFDTLEVLKGVSLEVQSGEFVAIVGKSGAGKTTLLQIIGTLDKPDSGQVIIDGKDVFSLSDRDMAEWRNRHIGFIFQMHQLLPEFTALENVMMPALIGLSEQKHPQFTRTEIRQRAITLLEKLGLQDRLEHKPNQLSGGERQRVAAARAMMMKPSVILADEPSGSLDEQNKQDLHKLLKQLQQEYHQTIIVVTHDRELAEQCDRIIEIKDGIIQ